MSFFYKMGSLNKLFIICTFIYLVSISESLIQAAKSKAYYKSLPPVDFSLANAVKTDVIYRLFKNISDNHGTFVTEKTIKETNLQKEIPTKVLIHGWTTNDSAPWYPLLKKKYFEHGPHNIIYINWQKAGNLSYNVSSANVKPVGKFIAQFLINCGVQKEQIHLIGHSLGSQVTAFIGKFYKQLKKQKLGRITGLDPAGPKFENPQMTDNLRLSKEDAEFVDIVHTDIEFYGYTMPCGHVDFYPNNGGHQPGCPPREDHDSCSHARSTLYFAQSISKSIYATECIIQAGDSVKVKSVKGGNQVVFGQNTDKSARGCYSFSTKSKEPFF